MDPVIARRNAAAVKILLNRARLSSLTELAFSEFFAGEPAEARILARLYGAKAPIAPTPLADGICRPSSLKVRLSGIRSTMGPTAIQRTGDGYVLTPAGRAECDLALAEVYGEAARGS